MKNALQKKLSLKLASYSYVIKVCGLILTFGVTLCACAFYRSLNPDSKTDTIDTIDTSLQSQPRILKPDQNFNALKSFNYGASDLIIVTLEGEILHWKNKENQFYLVVKVSKPVTAAAQKQNLLVVSHGGATSIFKTNKFQPIAILNKLPIQITSLEIEPDLQTVILGAGNGDIYRWKYTKESITNRSNLEKYVAHSVAINAINILTPNKVFISADSVGSINVWSTYDNDANQGSFDRNLGYTNIFINQAERNSVSSRRESAVEDIILKDKFLVLSRASGEIELWSIRGFEKVFSTKAHTGLVSDLIECEGDGSIYSYGRDGYLNKWQVNSNNFEQTDSKKIENLQQLICINNKLYSLAFGNITEIKYET